MATRTVVAAAKLTIPTFRRPLVPRPELVVRLDGDFRVALVSAPAGYGKTATLASWAAAVDRPLAWLSCDPSDVEPTRFMSCLLSSIAATWPGVTDDAFVLLEREGGNTYDAAVAVANELALVDDPGVIVVDDIHLAAPDPATLTAFIGALPDRFRFVARSSSSIRPTRSSAPGASRTFSSHARNLTSICLRLPAPWPGLPVGQGR